jgi:hypothetical protein
MLRMPACWKGGFSMSEGNLQEWEEYDARLLDDTQVRQSTLATPRLASQFPQASPETPGASEGPFQLGNAGETQAEMEGKSSILQSRFQFIDFPPVIRFIRALETSCIRHGSSIRLAF